VCVRNAAVPEKRQQRILKTEPVSRKVKSFGVGSRTGASGTSGASTCDGKEDERESVEELQPRNGKGLRTSETHATFADLEKEIRRRAWNEEKKGRLLHRRKRPKPSPPR